MLVFSEHFGVGMSLLKTQPQWLSESVENSQCRLAEHSENNTRSNCYVVVSINNLPGMEIRKERVFFLWKLKDHKRPNSAQPFL